MSATLAGFSVFQGLVWSPYPTRSHLPGVTALVWETTGVAETPRPRFSKGWRHWPRGHFLGTRNFRHSVSQDFVARGMEGVLLGGSFWP